ncbi:MAG: HEAT repeat domain-containing protein [Chromatiales bacterium]|nr:HEAT repeat domain-containing protein [Chromatiales bacterium]
MKFFSALKADRCLTQLLAEPDLRSGAARKALDTLRGLDPSVIPRIIDSFARADTAHSEALGEALGAHLNDRNISWFAEGLGHGNPRCVNALARVLIRFNGYDPNALLGLLGNSDVSKSALFNVLQAQRERLNPRELLRRAYELDPQEKAAAFAILKEIATEELVPDLIARADGRDPGVRVHLIELLAQFAREDVARALEEQLGDRNKTVRRAALDALARMPGERNIDRICALLADPDLEVQSRAVDVVVALRHPDTLRHLVEVLKDESEFARRSAVEVLNEIAEPGSVKHLLRVLGDDDWWVRSRACDALARIGGPRVMDAVLQLVGDKDENIRRSAIEILNQTRDERAVSHLVNATRDPDWWVRERAADALAEIGDPKSVPALVSMLDGDPRSAPAALRALGRLGDREVLPRILPMLDSPEKEIRVEAMQAASRLVDRQSASELRQRLQAIAEGGDEATARVATEAVARIDSVLTGAIETSQSHPPHSAGPVNTLLVERERVEEVLQAADQLQRIDVSKFRPGEIIEGRYQFIEKIGKGAFGTVVLVEDSVVGERLILKFLNPNMSSDEDMMKRFVHELRYSRKITHPNVIRIYDFVSLGGNYAISMEYFPSHTLSAELSARKPLPFDKVVGWGRDIASGMAVAHQVGIIHRDLKPANILINDEGLLKIVDFGVAAAAHTGDTQLTKTGYVIGSPKYMAPEQILGKKVDLRSDIYSVGVILYEMLTGVPPYTKGDHMSVMYQHVQGKARRCEELNPQIPAPLAAVVHRAMEVDKLKRYDSMDELKEALALAQAS